MPPRDDLNEGCTIRYGILWSCIGGIGNQRRIDGHRTDFTRFTASRRGYPDDRVNPTTLSGQACCSGRGTRRSSKEVLEK